METFMDASVSTVLVVDNEGELVNLISHYLEMNGYKVIAAQSAEEALSKIHSEIQVIVSDIHLNKTSGPNFFKQVTHHLGFSPHIVFLSNLNSDEIIKNIHLSCSFEVLDKPINFKKLIHSIEQISLSAS